MRSRGFSLASAGLAVIGSAILAFAQEYTDANRVTNFAALLGTGNYCKLTWQVGNSIAGQGTAIKYMDSKNGTIVSLSTATGGQLMRPTFTWDGKKIVYNVGTINSEIAYTACSVHAIDISGTSPGADQLVTNDFVMTGCWQDGSGKQYIVGTQLSTFKMYRMEIGNTTNKQEFLFPPSGGEAGPSWWASLSTDAKYLCGDFFGVANLKSCQLNWNVTPAAVVAPSGNAACNVVNNGCWITMARDATGDHLNQCEGGSSASEGSWGPHQAWVVESWDGSSSTYYNLTKAAPDGFAAALTGGEAYTVTRWGGNRDYVTASRQGAGDGDVASSGAQPFVCRLSNRHWTSVYKSTSGVVSETDLYWYTSTNAVAQPKSSLVKQQLKGSDRMFDLCGRALMTSKIPRPSVIIAQQKNSAGEPKFLVGMPAGR